MKTNTYLIMPMAGAGSRFFNDGYECPKPLISLHGKPFFSLRPESQMRTSSPRWSGT